MAIPISEFFRVTTRIEVGGVVTQEFGRGLLLTEDDALSAGGVGKSLYFTDNDAVRDVFDSDSAAAKAAAKWFSYDPYPQGLYIGRWARTNIDTRLTGAIPDALADIAVANASFRIASVDTTVDLSGEATYAAVAAAIQEELRTSGYTGSVHPLLATGTITIATPPDGSGFVQDTASAGAAVDETVLMVAPTGGGTRAVAVVVAETGGAATQITFDPSVKAGANPGSGYTAADTGTVGDAGVSIAVDATATTAFTTDPAWQVPLGRQAASPILDGVEVRFENNRFVIDLAGTSELDPPYMETHSAATGTDISELLGLAQFSNPSYKQGSDAESPSDAVVAILRNHQDPPTYLMLDDDIPLTYGDDGETIPDMWTFAEAGDYIFGFSDISDGARNAGETTSLLARANSAQLGNTLVCVADDDQTSHVGALAALSSINWDQPASIITLFGKTLPGIGATDVTPTELNAIQAKRGNVYTRVGGLPTFIEGFMARAGYWSDAVAFNLWIKNELELNIWNAARASRRLTIAILASTLDAVMRKGVRNGGIQPGRTVSNASKADIIQTTGNHEFDGVLPSGYLVHIGALAAQTQVDIDNRKAPPIKIWAKGSEAIHQADVDLVFSN